MLLEVREQRDGLHPLAQPHLVAQDPVEPVLVEGDQLVHAHLRGTREAVVWQHTGSVQLLATRRGAPAGGAASYLVRVRRRVGVRARARVTCRFTVGG